MFIDFLMIAILTSMKWYIIVHLIFISLIIIDVLLTCLFAISVSSLEDFLFSHFVHLLIFCFSHWAGYANCIFWKWIPCQSLYLQIFSPILWIVFFSLFIIYFAVQKFLSLVKYHLFIFVFISITQKSGSKKILLQYMLKTVLPVFSTKSFIASSL